MVWHRGSSKGTFRKRHGCIPLYVHVKVHAPPSACPSSHLCTLGYHVFEARERREQVVCVGGHGQELLLAHGGGGWGGGKVAALGEHSSIRVDQEGLRGVGEGAEVVHDGRRCDVVQDVAVRRGFPHHCAHGMYLHMGSGGVPVLTRGHLHAGNWDLPLA